MPWEDIGLPIAFALAVATFAVCWFGSRPTTDDEPLEEARKARSE